MTEHETPTVQNVEKHLRKCEHFKRAHVSTGEVSWCGMQGVDMHCAGWSDLCPIPDQFTADDGTRKENIIFSMDTDRDSGVERED
jgi:hypothetical protein